MARPEGHADDTHSIFNCQRLGSPGLTSVPDLRSARAGSGLTTGCASCQSSLALCRLRDRRAESRVSPHPDPASDPSTLVLPLCICPSTFVLAQVPRLLCRSRHLRSRCLISRGRSLAAMSLPAQAGPPTRWPGGPRRVIPDAQQLSQMAAQPSTNFFTFFCRAQTLMTGG